MSTKHTAANDTRRFAHKKEVFLVIVILAVVFGLLYLYKPTFLPFIPFTEANVLGIVTSLFVVAIFMERSVEAILIPIRTPDRKKIEQELARITHVVNMDSNRQTELLIKKQELENYKLTTAKFALWLSFGFGLLISLVGVRTLAGLVDPDAIANLGDMHHALFQFVDIVLTGGVIAGGSTAIDKIGRKISKNLHLTSAIDSE